MSSLRACLRLVAERENKETINTKYYDVSNPYNGACILRSIFFLLIFSWPIKRLSQVWLTSVGVAKTSQVISAEMIKSTGHS